MKYLMIIYFLISNFIAAQQLNYLGEYGDFAGAVSFDLDLNRNFFVADIIENTISKLDSVGNEILTVGGYGWQKSSFDEPVSVFTNTLSVYVADKNNDRIQRFDKDLNYLSLYSGDGNNSNIEFGYPTCIAISNIGNLLFLDSDNNRILKFNLTGEFLLEIGGNDAGNFALSNPKYFSTDSDGNIFVLDNNSIKVFDQYGNGQYSFTLDFNPLKIHILDQNILYVEKERIVLFSLKERRIIYEFSFFLNLDKETIIDAQVVEKYLFVLTSSRILKYKIIN